MLEPEEFRDAGADRLPTKDEEKAAEAAAATVDVEQVAEEYEHMTKLGARVKGEGQIEPEAD